MPLIKLTPIECKGIKEPDDIRVEIPSKLPSARAAAEAAINEFQAMIFDLTYEQAKDAYARLLVGRGFDRVDRYRRQI
jgi:hypothetical protein